MGENTHWLNSKKEALPMAFYRMIQEIENIQSGFLSEVLSCLDRKSVEEVFGGSWERERVYHPWALVSLFLGQIALNVGTEDAVAFGIHDGILPRNASPHNSAYCNARRDYPERCFRELSIDFGKRLAERAWKKELFFGRRSLVVDQTTFRLPDTSSNQLEYPQPSAQKAGLGSPVMYVCCLMDLSTGAIIDVESGSERTSERTKFRAMWERSIEKGDIMVQDAGYGSYAEACMLSAIDVDSLFRLNSRLFNGYVRRLGPGDWLVEWSKPKQLPGWVDPESLPDKLVIREIHYCPFPGAPEIRLATTLTDPCVYSRNKLINLYLRRWDMELRFDDIKTVMHLETLRSKTPSGCRKELYMGLLAYNMIRAVMIDAARAAGISVRKISFTRALNRILAFAFCDLSRINPKAAYDLLKSHLNKLALKFRPHRQEPRKVKRRNTKYRLLTTPRNTARYEVLSA